MQHTQPENIFQLRCARPGEISYDVLAGGRSCRVAGSENKLEGPGVGAAQQRLSPASGPLSLRDKSAVNPLSNSRLHVERPIGVAPDSVTRGLSLSSTSDRIVVPAPGTTPGVFFFCGEWPDPVPRKPDWDGLRVLRAKHRKVFYEFEGRGG